MKVGDKMTYEEKYLKKYNPNFYKTYKWKIKRKEILVRDNYECQKCKARGKVAKATTVHHKKEYKYFPNLALTDENLQSLCRACHEEEHPDRLKKFEKVKEYQAERWE